jgi:hypothetical protein
MEKRLDKCNDLVVFLDISLVVCISILVDFLVLA